jgi:hypothetical protein
MGYRTLTDFFGISLVHLFLDPTILPRRFPSAVPDWPLPVTSIGDDFHDHGGISFQQDSSVVLVSGDDTLTFVPEPVSLTLFCGGLSGLVLSRRRA